MARKKAAVRKHIKRATRKPVRAKAERFLTSSIRPAPRVDRRFRVDSEEWALSGSWIPVQSTNVAAIQYHREDKKLLVLFRSGGAFVYNQVPERTAQDMFNANSIGIFVDRKLKNRFTCTPIKITVNLYAIRQQLINRAGKLPPEEVVHQPPHALQTTQSKKTNVEAVTISRVR